ICLFTRKRAIVVLQGGQRMSFSFEHPQFLWAAAVPVLLFLFFVFKPRSAKRPSVWRLSGPALLKKESRRAKWRLRAIFGACVVALVLMALAAARPVELTSWTRKTSEGIDISIVLDVSESMEADDFPPNRMVVAKTLIKDFIRRRSEDRLSFVTFGGEAV